MLTVGSHIPPFEALDSDGNDISHEDLLGSFVVIYFYPKDGTPGCTKEACDFRDINQILDEQGVIVLGVSPDGMQSHQQFVQKHNLNFSLLCDEDQTLCRLFGVLKEQGKVERTTFVIDEKGIVRWIERPVSIEGHAERVMKALDELER